MSRYVLNTVDNYGAQVEDDLCNLKTGHSNFFDAHQDALAWMNFAPNHEPPSRIKQEDIENKDDDISWSSMMK